MPTLVIHGVHDQIVPIDVGGRRTARNGLMSTHQHEFNSDLLEFARRVSLSPV